MDDPQALSRPENYSIRDLHSMVRQGRIRVPEFQRSFRWERRDVLALVDSLLRGFPVGSLLLWKRPAEAETLAVGALRIEAPARPDALWVVDGQQRITSLVNAVDPDGATDPRFAIGYSLREKKVVALRQPADELVVPLPDLFDLGRALAWLGDHPEATDEVRTVQEVVGQLANVAIPATVMEDADESVLREVFDRINSRGRRLNAAEVFDAIHGGPGDSLTMDGIRARVAAATSFGLIPDKVALQALLIRRHTDITRDVHNEFSASRRRVSDFPDEGKDEAYHATEAALAAAVGFLQEDVGVPHWAFLPYRFQLLVLTRFFGLFPEPDGRNRDLLARWFWRTSVGADALGITGSERDLRVMTQRVVAGEESDSVQRLLAAARLAQQPTPPDLSQFRTTRSDSKVILTAMWSCHPVDLRTGVPMTREALAEILEGASTPTPALTQLVPPRVLGDGGVKGANVLISGLDSREVMAHLTDSLDAAALGSLLLDEGLLGQLQRNEDEPFLTARASRLREFVSDFLTVRTGHGFDDTPPLADLVHDPGSGSEGRIGGAQ